MEKENGFIADLKRIKKVIPGSFSVLSLLFFIGLITTFLSFFVDSHNDKAALIAVLTGLGTAMIISSILGIINDKVLVGEIDKVSKLSVDDMAFLNKVKSAGIRNLFRDRRDTIKLILEKLREEKTRIINVGSSLKGILGVGTSVEGSAREFREALSEALGRGVNVYILMTNPDVAHHRQEQEGRMNGDIEYEIFENMIFLWRLKYKNDKFIEKLNLKLYSGTPTIFLLCTSTSMMFNPYPYHSTAYNSYSFIVQDDTDLYKLYYNAHFREAWNSTRATLKIEGNTKKSDDKEDNAKQKLQAANIILKMIYSDNPHCYEIIPDETRRARLVEMILENEDDDFKENILNNKRELENDARIRKENKK